MNMKQEDNMLVLSEDIYQFAVDIEEVGDIPENPISLNSINLL